MACLAPPTALSATLCAELAKLDQAAIAELIGELLEPSINTPFTFTDELADALIPVSDAYSAAFADITAAVNGEDDPDAAFWADADRLYDERRELVA